MKMMKSGVVWLLLATIMIIDLSAKKFDGLDGEGGTKKQLRGSKMKEDQRTMKKKEFDIVKKEGRMNKGRSDESDKVEDTEDSSDGVSRKLKKGKGKGKYFGGPFFGGGYGFGPKGKGGFAYGPRGGFAFRGDGEGDIEAIRFGRRRPFIRPGFPGAIRPFPGDTFGLGIGRPFIRPFAAGYFGGYGPYFGPKFGPKGPKGFYGYGFGVPFGYPGYLGIGSRTAEAAAARSSSTKTTITQVHEQSTGTAAGAAATNRAGVVYRRHTTEAEAVPGLLSKEISMDGI